MASLCAILVEAIPAERRAPLGATRAAIDAWWDEALAAAATARPSVVVAKEAFVAYVANRLAPELPVTAALEQLALSDLMLAYACTLGDERALAVFESEYMDLLGAVVGHVGVPADAINDVKQRVRRRLFVSASGGPARIAGYEGRGDLASWVRVVAIREGLGLLRERGRGPAGDQHLAAIAADGDSPEAALMRGRVQSEFRVAFAAAMQTLTTRERNVLRYHLLDSLSIDRIGAIYGVHRATAARWAGKARQRLLRETRRRLKIELSLDQQEFESVMRLIRSRLDVSIHRMLAEEHDPR